MNNLLESLVTAVLEGDAERTVEVAQNGLSRGRTPKEILDSGLVAGMSEVGGRFRDGEMFIPEVLASADAMQAGLRVLRPLLASAGVRLLGKIVLGTVQGDLHDIGKNLVGMMCEGAGFEVVDLGFNVPPDGFVAAVKQHRPDIVGLSALLTTTMRMMAHTIQALEEAGLREHVKIMVGGAPVDAEFAKRIGADGYGSNAPAGAELARAWVALG